MRVPARVISPGVTVPIVAIDGPAGAGKSTVARQLARRLGFTIIDTGAIYRSVALAARRAAVGWEDDEGLRRLLHAGLGITFRGDRVLLGGEDVTDAIRVDTTGLDLDQVVERCFREASERLKHLNSGQP